MNGLKTLAVLSLVLLWTGTVLAQDPLKVDAGH
jgi:hypothetical protein